MRHPVQLARLQHALVVFEAILKSGGIHSVFQPIVELPTGRLHAYEMLGRSPRRIDGEAEYRPPTPQGLLRMGVGVGRLVELERHFQRAALCAASTHPLPPAVQIHLNFDPRVLDDPDWDAEWLAETVDEVGLTRHRIVLEITETSPRIERGRTRELLEQHRTQGFRIALDDVGAGYATVRALDALRPDVVKLDAGLVQGVGRHAGRRAVLRDLAARCHDTGAEVIAEGIEDPADAETVAQLGIEYVQGYLYGAPAAAPTFASHPA
jgi:EAL domain-containing protein (putative c-di-GMP-specific phosphodiesterase class I)